MELTTLEQDLLGDMAQDDHCLFEVFQFVRLHHGEQLAVVRLVGRQLLASWIARGWLQTVDGPVGPTNTRPVAISQVLELVDRAETLDAAFLGAETRLRLTEQAYADVEWLSRAS